MRERLIELLKGNLPHFTNDVASWNDEHIGELADHLLANGVVVPPVKVGQTIYFIGGIYSNLIKTAIVEEIILNDSGVRDLLVTSESGVEFEDSIETFFLTREDAERALKEKRNEGDFV